MSERHFPLSELVSNIVDNRGRTCPTSETGIPLIATNCIKNESLYPEKDKLRYVSRATYDEWFRDHPKPGDIIFVNKGTPGRVCLVPDPVDFCIAQDMVALRANEHLIYPNYLFALLRSPQTQAAITNLHVGTMIPHFKKTDFDKLILPVPDRSAQIQIGDLYVEFCKAIHILEKTNETLEAIAKALFKSWFIDFDPVRAKAEGRPTGLPTEISDLFPDSFEDSELGEIPRGWKVQTFGSLLSISRDSINPSEAPLELFDHYSIPAYDSGCIPNKEFGGSIKSQKFLVEDDSLLVSKLNPSSPRVWIPYSSGTRRRICSTEFLVCRTFQGVGRSFAYCLASSDPIIETMIGLAGGTSNSHQRIRPEDFLNLTCCPGNEQVRTVFCSLVDPIMNSVLWNKQESVDLGQIRDTLLPKLISGELRIPDAEALVAEAGL